jgi:hypothetical protein
MDNILDTLIFTCASERWQKVARVIAQVADRAPAGINFDTIAARIKALVGDGKLEAKGDLSRWGHSEVRQGDRAK